MFETDAYESHLHRPTQPLRPVHHYEPAAGVAEMSMLIWGEHCIECAAPSCFQTCDLYQKRPDQRCRRFSYGIYRNRHFASLRNFGAEVSFKKWGKLESRGNTSLMPRERLLTLEHLLYLSRPFSNVLGASINALTRDIRWSYVTHSLRERLVRWLHRRGANARQPEAFLLEIYNPGPDVARLQLVISPVKSETGGRGPTPLTAPFRARLDLPVGYSRHQFSRTQFAKVTERPFDIALIPDAETTPTLVFLTADFVAFDPQRKDQQRSPVKCIVWDLDNTLWDGVLLENDNVRLREEFIAVIQQLDQRGLLHSVASKNDHKHAWQKLTELGIADYFLYPQINWSPKGENIRTIATTFNLGLDTFAFVDDSEFELAQVGELLPEVACFTPRDVPSFASNPRFAGSNTLEARTRRQLYKDIILREEEQTRYGDDYLGFLSTCNISLSVRHPDPNDRDRIDDLVQRTNQLNVSGRKYKREELQPILNDLSLEKYVLDCADKYGSYGTVGFAIVRRDSERIDVRDFMLSCRVQGKFIEQAFFNYLCQTHPGSPPKRLSVNYVPTARNLPARKVLETLNFGESSDDGLTLDLTRHSLSCDFIRVESKTSL